jgi:LPS sulfotransferase NodH
VILAPVGVSVYTRLAHFKKTIEALKKNTLASHTNLIVYSDAANVEKDIDSVNKVRCYSQTISGFRTVTIIERPNNYGGVKNAHQAVIQLVRIFKQAIFIEDDIETAPGFLAYMNEALEFYKDDPNVTSISGYSPPLNISEYVANDYYVMNRFCGWGCGVYERTVDLLRKKISQVEFDSLEDKSVLCEFGDDVLKMVEREVTGELDAADVRCMYRQAIHETATIYPRLSLVQNNGHDGSGYHCGITKRFQHSELWGKTEGFDFSDNLSIDPRIKSEQQYFRAFKGNYAVKRVLNNQQQSKKVALSYIDNLFKKDLSRFNIKDNTLPHSHSRKVAILSTPRVGSTYLSYLLYPYFGESIRREWLHNRYAEIYIANKQGENPLNYLQFIQNNAFSDSEFFGLHLHINQVIAWQEKYGINIFEYYGFDHVVYMERKDIFAQSYSLAVASESGLWGSEIINALNFASGFKVEVTEDAFDKAYKMLIREREYFDQNIKTVDTKVIQYEDLVLNPDKMIKRIFEDEYKLSKGSDVIQGNIEVPEKSVSIICEENKKELESYFQAKYM